MIDASSLFLIVQILFVDLLLGADNAIVIAMACGRLPPEDSRRAIILGSGGAIALRLAMLMFANALLGVPLVKLVCAWMLLVIALNVRAENGGGWAATPSGGPGPHDFVSAAVVITFADATMSLDNVVALAAIAGGNFWLLGIGVLISIPILVYGAFILTRILRLAPEIFTIGAAFLGWIAGGMATSDPLVSGWIDANAPALVVFAPALTALFVLAAGKGGMRPAARRLPAASRSAAPQTSPPRATLPSPPAVGGPAPRAPAAPAPEPVKPADRPAAPAGLAVLEPPALLAPAPPDDAVPGFASEAPVEARRSGWTEERLVVVGFILIAFLAGLIIFIASFFDSLT